MPEGTVRKYAMCAASPSSPEIAEVVLGEPDPDEFRVNERQILRDETAIVGHAV